MIYAVVIALARFFFGVSIIGGTAATAIAATSSQAQPLFALGGIEPEQASQWISVIANAIPAIGGALLLLYANFLQERLKARLADEKAAEPALRVQLENALESLSKVTAERDLLAARLEQAELVIKTFRRTEPEPQADAAPAN